MEATRDLDVNDVILEDDAAVLGPDHDTVPVCLECLSREGRRKEIGNNYANQSLENLFTFKRGTMCKFPVNQELQRCNIHIKVRTRS